MWLCLSPGADMKWRKIWSHRKRFPAILSSTFFLFSSTIEKRKRENGITEKTRKREKKKVQENENSCLSRNVEEGEWKREREKRKGTLIARGSSSSNDDDDEDEDDDGDDDDVDEMRSSQVAELPDRTNARWERRPSTHPKLSLFPSLSLSLFLSLSLL